MKNINIELIDNCLKISGIVTFDDLVDLLSTCIKKTANLDLICVDLENLYSSNSSVLIFMINYIRSAIKKKQDIRFINIPDLLVELSKIYNFNKMIYNNEV